MEDLKGGVPIGRTQLRGVLAVLQWWGFNVLVIIMNKWIFQVSAHLKFRVFHGRPSNFKQSVVVIVRLIWLLFVVVCYPHVILLRFARLMKLLYLKKA